ncbi:MAG: HAD-IIIC family phosphatase [Anaerolineales bacterium]|nr:HAD-IIIC family phosphatase [Anaerolineales bacterium]
MREPDYQCLIVSDFNVSNFAGYLDNDPEAPRLACHCGPFGQVVQVLGNRDLDCWHSPPPDCLVVWTQPGRVIHGFSQLMAGGNVALDEILAEVDQFAALLAAAAQQVKSVFVPTWVMPPFERGLGMLDLKMRAGFSVTRMRMNLRLVEALEQVPNLYLLNAERWFQLAGKAAFNPKAWYLGKIAYGNDVYKEAVRDIKAGLRGIAGQARKLILLDLDDTLWGGIVGDIGWENLQLGGHDAAGEAFVDFQQALKALKSRGVLLGIVSKNEESVALAAIDEHPEMVLRRDDFAGWRINWGDKALNVADLVAELNLGLQSVVFIDDNPAERARVREALPEVLVPDWPEEKMLYRKTLQELACFDIPVLSREDLDRTQMYVAERKRKISRHEVGSLEEWLASLEIKVVVEELDESNLPRATQLLNKTNQLNLATRRMTEAELLAWARQPNHSLRVFRVTDKFGDYGLTGLASLTVEATRGRIVDFILSCRVMGRRVEETIFHHMLELAAEQGAREVLVEYLATPKNKPCLTFLESSGLSRREDGTTFFWKTAEPYPRPSQVEIEVQPA